MKQTLLFSLLFVGPNLLGQVTYSKMLANDNFHWLADSSSQEFTIYYQPESWTAKNVETVKQWVVSRIHSVNSFVGIKSYQERIHFFIVDSRAQMKLLIGWETNGTAFYKLNIITGIASENINSVYSNHELFHLIAMNVWGLTDTWLNEGMAVYSDNRWQRYDLDQLTKYLIDHNRYVPLEELIKHFRKADDLVSYPLAGSFAKYLDEVYGRETVLKIWRKGTKGLKIFTGKTIKALEKEWLAKINATEYKEINY